MPCDRLREYFCATRKNLRTTIRKAHEAAWREIVDSVKIDSWSRAYKIVSRKIGGSPPGAESAGRENVIVDGLFPVMPPVCDPIVVWLGYRLGTVHPWKTGGGGY